DSAVVLPGNDIHLTQAALKLRFTSLSWTVTRTSVMLPPLHSSRVRLLYLGTPQHETSPSIRQKYPQFDIDILDVSSRTELLVRLPMLVASSGPYQGVVCRLGTQAFEPFDAELLSPLLPALRIVVSAMKGFDDFDVEWMTKSGIWFCNTRNATVPATADMALYLILAVLRRTFVAEESVRHGCWRGALALAREPTGLTLGIVGMGAIGTCLARKAFAIGLKVRYYARDGGIVRNAPEDAMYCSSLEELLTAADIISLHCPLTESTRHLIGERELAIMKDGSYIINTARGPIVDNAALIEALKSGKIAGAGLDVFEGEPYNIHPYFMESDRVAVQPHMGGLTVGSFERAEEECLQNIQAWSTSGSPRMPVNMVTSHPVARHDSVQDMTLIAERRDEI
ncbi:Dehydrogenase, partial [Teratosphaeria destructans]